MGADEHIRRSFEALADRLRDTVSRELDAITGELASAIDHEHGESLAAAHEERERALEHAASEREQALEHARQSAREEAERGVAERLAASVAEAESRGHATGHALGHEAGREEARREWDNGRTEALELARAEREGADLAASARLLDAVRAIERAGSLSEVLDTLIVCAGREAARVAVFMVRGDRLRAWRFVGFGAPLDDTSDYELAIADAGVIADALASGGPSSADRASSSASAPAFASPQPGRDTLAVPIAMNGQIVAVLYADQGDGETAGARASWPVAVEIITRHAARSLEAITAFRAAQVLTERPSAPGADARSSAPARTAPAADPADEEQAARRYARLLISEIKLYHEPDVIAGRRERNLAERLGGEIARARVLYEQRVRAHVRGRGDYFGEELVRTLADGDPALLAS